jgi:hypothetical protein
VAVDTRIGPFRRAWRLFREFRREFLLAMLVLFAEWAVLEVLVITLNRLGPIVNVILHGAFLIVFSGSLLGLHRMALMAHAGRRPGLRELAPPLSRGISFLAASILYGVSVTAGLVLLVAPGLYLAVRWAFYPQVLASTDLSALAALKRSWTITSGRWSKCAGVLGLGILVTLAGAALLGVGAFVGIPVAVLAMAGAFRAGAAERES